VVDQLNAEPSLVEKINARCFSDPIYNQAVGGSAAPAKVVTLDIILRIILRNLEHTNPKIVWNSCVTVGNAATNSHFMENPQ
jgi:hypothetical protein